MGPQKRILIVDDSDEDRQALRRYLSKHTSDEFAVVEAETGEQALDMLREQTADCVLLDYNLPDLDGLEVLGEINGIDGQVPVVMLTGMGNETVAVESMKAGAQDYLMKGAVTPTNLHRAIRNAIEKVALQKQIEENRAELERSNRELEQFAYVVSHDLQAPLRSIKSFCQLIERAYRGKLSKEADGWIDFVVDGAERMQLLIQDLLRYSRLHTRGQPFEPTDCNRVFDEVTANLATVIDETGARVTRDDLPEVAADRTQFGQVFQNLIANAVKFHGDNTPRVHVSAMANGSGQVFCVRDNGIGIATQYHERVFEVFKRLHGESSQYEGTGIGLAICRRVIERHGGRIWIESDGKTGSAFYFTIPQSSRHAPRDEASGAANRHD